MYIVLYILFICNKFVYNCSDCFTQIKITEGETYAKGASLNTKMWKQTLIVLPLGREEENMRNRTHIKRRITDILDAIVDYNMCSTHCNDNLNKKFMETMVKRYVWSTLLYDVELWTLK